MTDAKLTKLLDQSESFLEAVFAHTQTLDADDDARPWIAFQCGLLALEHWTAIYSLLRIELTASAYAMMRPQFECLVRGVWLLYAASDAWVIKLNEPLTIGTAKRADDGPMLAAMLKALEECSAAPKHLVGQLIAYRDVTWKALNSYSHGGLHPLARGETGYPPSLTYDVLRNANAVASLTSQLLTVLTGDPRDMAVLRRIHEAHVDCMPILDPTA